MIPVAYVPREISVCLTNKEVLLDSSYNSLAHRKRIVTQPNIPVFGVKRYWNVMLAGLSSCTNIGEAVRSIWGAREMVPAVLLWKEKTPDPFPVTLKDHSGLSQWMSDAPRAFKASVDIVPPLMFVIAPFTIDIDTENGPCQVKLGSVVFVARKYTW